MTFIIDAHQDIAFNALTFGRDFELSAYEIRSREKDTLIPVRNNGEATLGWADYQRGKIAVIFSTLYLSPRKYKDGEYETQVYSNPKEARVHLQEQIDYYRSLSENGQHYQLITSQTELSRVLDPWQNEQPGDHPVGLVMLLEGAEGLGDPRELEDYYEKGLRLVGPVWAGNRYMGGTLEDRPFDAEGRKLLEVMSSLRLTLDISHMRENAALTSLDLYDGNIMASHADCRAVNGGLSERHLTDLTIRRLVERDGVMGIVPYNKFLRADWTPSSPRNSVTLKDVVKHIDHVCQIAGDSRHAAIGTDFDGGFGFPSIPAEMDTIADLQKLAPELTSLGYTEDDIKNIFHLNWLNLLERSLPK